MTTTTVAPSAPLIQFVVTAPTDLLDWIAGMSIHYPNLNSKRLHQAAAILADGHRIIRLQNTYGWHHYQVIGDTGTYQVDIDPAPMRREVKCSCPDWRQQDRHALYTPGPRSITWCKHNLACAYLAGMFAHVSQDSNPYGGWSLLEDSDHHHW